MIKSKFPQPEKARVLTLDKVPDDFGSTFYSFERLRLVHEDGSFVATYKNTGSVVVGNFLTDKETKNIKALGQMVALEVHHPIVASAHDNDTLQIFDFTNDSSEKVQGEADSIKKIQCIMSDETSIYCISPTTVSIYTKDRIDLAPRSIPLNDVREGKPRALHNIHHTFSHLISSKSLLLGNSDVFQVWIISDEKDEMFLEFEGRSSNPQLKYFGVYYAFNTVVTTNKETFLLWDLTKPIEETKNPLEANENGIITTVFMDDSFIILGTSLGILSLRNRLNGNEIYELNMLEPGAQAVSHQEGSLMDVHFEYKVNSIQKIGQWVFCSFENSRFAIYDIVQERGEPVFIYTHNRPLPLREMLIGRDFTFVTVKGSAGSTGKTKKADSDLIKKEKPEIAMCSPKLPGYDFYHNQLNNATSQSREGTSFTLVLTYRYLGILKYLNSIAAAGEDVTEFTSVNERVAAIASQFLKNMDFYINFKKLKNLHLSLDAYQSLLEKLTSSGKLVRFFTSSRLRRGLEVQNSELHTHLNEIEELLRVCMAERMKTKARAASVSNTPASPSNSEADKKQRAASSPTSRFFTRGNSQAETPVVTQSPSSPVNTRARAGTQFPTPGMMISDEDGKAFWSENYGPVLMVEWKKFMDAFSKKFGGSVPEDDLRDVLDHGYTGYMSQYKFSEFLKGFGPLDKCVHNFKTILSMPWFHRFLNSREAELLLKLNFEIDGTFLLRFSKSKPGSFAMAFIKRGDVRHILIESDMPRGLYVSEQDNSGSVRKFQSLFEIIQHYSFVLKYNFISNIPQQDWFNGDISTEEANELLTGQAQGTFFIRFSSKGTFAASFVESRGGVRHVLISTPQRDCYEVTTGDKNQLTFGSLHDLVKYYRDKGVFKEPMKNGPTPTPAPAPVEEQPRPHIVIERRVDEHGYGSVTEVEL